MSAPAVSFRRPLTIEEVPLPPGYSRRILEEAYRAELREKHAEKVRQALEARARIVERASEDLVFRKKVMIVCERDPAFFVDHFVWTYDDRTSVEEPLVLYDFQREKIVAPALRRWATQGRERITQAVEKSRGVGYTWVEFGGLSTHAFLFKPSWSQLLGAVTREDVDDGGQEATHESLFGKIRFVISHLPRWMREELLGPHFQRDEYNKRYLLKNPLKPRNIIVGRQFGAMFGRGHRYSEVKGDEIAYAEQMANADTSLKQTTNRFAGGSTPQGKHTFHYQLMRGELKVERQTLHWSEHPDLDLKWYNEQREHMTDAAIASELDIDYEASSGNRVLPEVTVRTHFLAPTPGSTNVVLGTRHVSDGTLYVPTLPLHVIIDPGISDALATVWVQEDHVHHEFRVVDFVQVNDRAVDWIVPFILGVVPEFTYDGKPWRHDYNDVEAKLIERHARWRKPSEVFGDHYGSTRSMVTGGSCWDELARYGIFVCPVRIENDLQAISHLQLVMRHTKISAHLEEERTGPARTSPSFGEVVTQWRYKRKSTGEPLEVLKPVHDQFCHGGDCLKLWAQTVDLPEARVQPVQSGAVHRETGPAVTVSRSFPRRRRR